MPFDILCYMLWLWDCLPSSSSWRLHGDYLLQSGSECKWTVLYKSAENTRSPLEIFKQMTWDTVNQSLRIHFWLKIVQFYHIFPTAQNVRHWKWAKKRVPCFLSICKFKRESKSHGSERHKSLLGASIHQAVVFVPFTHHSPYSPHFLCVFN